MRAVDVGGHTSAQHGHLRHLLATSDQKTPQPVAAVMSRLGAHDERI